MYVVQYRHILLFCYEISLKVLNARIGADASRWIGSTCSVCVG
jgi:hypothetical protein